MHHHNQPNVYVYELGLPVLYRGENKGLHVLLSRTHSGPGRTVKQEQEEISRNHVQALIPGSVVNLPRGPNSNVNSKLI